MAPEHHRMDWRAIHSRRRAQRELTVLLNDLYPNSPEPSGFGMTRKQLRDEIARRVDEGWSRDEIAVTFTDPRFVPRSGWVA